MRTHKPFLITAGMADVKLIGPNSKRHAIIVTVSANAVVTIAFGHESTVTPDFVIASVTRMLYITRDMIGDLIQSDLRVTSAAGAAGVIVEVSDS